MRSLENLGKSRNMDMSRDPEGIYGHDKKDDEPLSFEEHLREARKLKDLIDDLPPDDSAETIKQNEEKLNKSRHLNSIGDFGKQDKMDRRARNVLREMGDVGNFGNQYRNSTDEERKKKIEQAREKVLESFKDSFNNNDNGPANRNIVDDSQIDYSPVVDEDNKPQMDYIPVTNYSQKEPIDMPSRELEEPVSSMEKASPEDEVIYHDFQMEQILGQFFPKTKKPETVVEHREGSVVNENLTGSLANNEESKTGLANNEKMTNESYPEQEREKEQIEQLKVQLSNCDNQIEDLISNMRPYMQIPKVSREISKVIEKNNDINSSQITDSINDYKVAVKAKQSLIAYLEQANKFIKDNIDGTQEPIAEQQSAQTQKSAQSLPDNFWDEFDKSQEKQTPTNQSFEEIMADFENPDPTVVPERKYNSDGTYTMEYIAHLANTPSGFNQAIYDQLMQENELKRKQNEDSTSVLNESNI